jgi:hypothetical protein
MARLQWIAAADRFRRILGPAILPSSPKGLLQ